MELARTRTAHAGLRVETDQERNVKWSMVDLYWWRQKAEVETDQERNVDESIAARCVSFQAAGGHDESKKECGVEPPRKRAAQARVARSKRIRKGMWSGAARRRSRLASRHLRAHGGAVNRRRNVDWSQCRCPVELEGM